MKENNYIINNPLPLTQDFTSLKNEGLDYITKIAGNEWTNLNPSDPGITILDQLCYALTELGYCNNFHIKDILTDHNDQLIIKDQFYLPNEILTTSPITPNDYIKYIIDEVNEVDNVVIVPIQSNLSYVKGTYSIYLAINPQIKDVATKLTICNTVFYRLNKRRNLGELFWVPQPLKEKKYTLTGQLQISSEEEASKIITLLENKIHYYIFPKVIRENTIELLSEDECTNTIYNGPEMRHGWINEAKLSEKKNSVTLRDLITIFQSTAAVHSIQNLQIKEAQPLDFVTATISEILTFDLSELTISYTNAGATNAINEEKSIALSKLISDTSQQQQDHLPKGKFRDINSYYSIQNTFPEIYAVGENDINSNASDFEIAQSRQLKGYLTLYDQILANQFSQLANVHQLFSFKNGITGTPSELKNFYATKTQSQKEQNIYPVPYLSFSPTYFYQALYSVPNIKPLLKNNTVFNYSLNVQTPNVAEEISWKKFKEDPYNSYIKGLQNCMEADNDNLKRRNDILDHLLARHGESPLYINAIIDGSLYTGNSQKDKIIIKSLYLQNLGLLSYNRYKGYNYLGAKKIASLSKIDLQNQDELFAQLDSLNFHSETETDFSFNSYENFETDFVFNTNKVDQIEKIRKQDFIDFSGLELQLNLLLSLKTPYINFLQSILETFDSENYSSRRDTNQTDENWITGNDQVEQIQQSLWFLKERKGVLCIENSLLYPINTTIVITSSILNGPYYTINEALTYTDIISLYTLLQTATTIEIGTKNDLNTSNIITINNSVSYDVIVTYSSSTSVNWSETFATETPYYFSIQNESISTINQDVPMITVIFPNYIPYFNTSYFKNRLELLLENTLPMEVSFSVHFIDQENLQNIIPAYTNWYNDIVFNYSSYTQKATTANDLITLLKTIQE
ncbi:conserved hypothetical protein [Flavobacterium sp. 9AF]|uniref:hypothetical protein n=1 Tax=Flavobacterium sp. 9AF TaxID=2653142 RepID=UPI0012F20B1B|nr:hypothetical protein [Flavobacterium sp. 9AF]VXB08604.1 conserved hypothetical protein [Flavobacterium sp. 9AF]